MTAGSDLHIVVLCWPKVIDNVLRICERLRGEACRKTVIDASGGAPRSVTGWEWLAIDPSAYFGRQFAAALRIATGSTILNIVGDMECDDWPAVVSACSRAFVTLPYLGVWSAEIDHTAWPTDQVAIQRIGGTELFVVSQTDCCVWALHPAVTERLRTLDFSWNNLGWGIDWTAIVACYGRGRIAVRDRSVTIHHPPSKGYDFDAAKAQMFQFLEQLTPPEKALLNVIYRSVGSRVAPSWKSGILARLAIQA